jgi:cytochrome o ubiquinol oxidase operon protein cyoD
MSGHSSSPSDRGDTAPGDQRDSGVRGKIVGYGVGLLLAAALTALSFLVAGTDIIWGHGIPVALLVFAVAQMGIHLVFFLHIGTGPDHTNNILALAFGVLIVGLVLSGSLWIMSHLNHNMMPDMASGHNIAMKAFP